MREWREVHGQLAALIAESGAKLNEKAAGYETVHQALLTGLLGNIGVKNEEGEYNGARGIRFAIHPSSGVRKRQPRWVIAAELVETTRLFARVVARVEAEWIERAAGHLVKRAWLEPRWDPERAEVVAWEQISLYGIVLIARRRVAYGRIDSPHARDIFIRAGLVEGGYVSRGAFQAHNVGLKCEVEAMEHKARRHGVLVDDEAMVRFFDTRLPAQVCSGASFESWRKHAEASDPRVLFMSLSDLVRPGTADVAALYPDTVELDDMVLSLAYRFDPGHPFDGVTATIPLHQLNRARPEPLEWLVPGLLRDKINALVRALPKHLRRQCVPLPETVTACLTILDGVAHTTPLVTALKDALKRARDIDVDVDHWDDLELAPYLRMNFRIVDEAGDEIACGRDLAALKTQYGIDAQTQFASESRWERAGLRAWDDLTLPESVDFIRARERLTGYPALIDEGDSARLSLLDTAAHAERANRTGICRLARIALKDQVRALERMFVPSKAVALSYAPYGSTDELVESLLTATLLRAIWTDPHSIRDRAAYDARLKDVRARLQLVGQEYNRIAETILIEASAIRREIETISAQAYKFASQDLALQLKALVFPRFLVEVAYEHLQHYPRYLAAMRRRMQKLPNAPDRDEHHTHELGKLWQQMEARRARNRKLGTAEALLEEYRWMLEEQRVSLFAQELKTPYPVSYKRLDKLWAQLRSAT
jgi:ATP-dependent helicase HrpA